MIRFSQTQCTVAQRATQQCREQQRGFTLVELLVVISIIALLISILLPSLRSARDQAKLVKCMAHERGMAQGGLSFAVDHNDRFQLVTNGVGVDEADPSRNKFAYGKDGELLTWPVAIAQSSGMSITSNWEWGVRANNPDEAFNRKEFMAEGFESFICPADRVQVASTFYIRGTGNGQLQGTGNPKTTVDDAIGNNTSYWGRLSYGINEDLVGAEVSSGPPAVGRWLRVGDSWFWAKGEGNLKAGRRLQGRLDQVFDPATVVLITDAGANTEDQLRAADTTDARGAGSIINLFITAKMSLSPVGNRDQLGVFMQTWVNRIPAKRHPKGAIGVVYADFHAETQKPTKWEKPPNFTTELPSEYSGVNRLSPFQSY